jgi:hypothetical protein
VTCDVCDRRRRQERPQDIGKPCDICKGTGFDYFDRHCRHIPHHSQNSLFDDYIPRMRDIPTGDYL